MTTSRTPVIDDTHDPALESWVPSANDPMTDFPVQNLPLGVFAERSRGNPVPRIGVAIGDQVLDLRAVLARGLLNNVSPTLTHALGAGTLNAYMAASCDDRRSLRRALSHMLRADDAARLRALSPALLPLAGVDLLLPASIGDYTDFYASVFHATNVGSMFRPGNPLLPNYKYVPIGYHGRASSIVRTGTPVKRLSGQTKVDDAPDPTFGPTKRLDYELEIV